VPFFCLLSSTFGLLLRSRLGCRPCPPSLFPGGRVDGFHSSPSFLSFPFQAPFVFLENCLFFTFPEPSTIAAVPPNASQIPVNCDSLPRAHFSNAVNFANSPPALPAPRLSPHCVFIVSCLFLVPPSWCWGALSLQPSFSGVASAL